MQNDKVKKENIHKNHRQRVKERFLLHGLDTFSEHQILEMALFFALPHVDTNEMAHHLINKAGSFTRVFDLPKEELETVSGIKDNASTFLKFLVAFTKYYTSKVSVESAKKGMTYDEIGKFLINFYVNEKQEVVVVCFFDEKTNLIGKKVIGVGDFNSVSVNLRNLVDDVLKTGARQVVLAHNHPTFSPVPSSEDISTSRNIENILNQVGVKLIESFIITNDKYLGVLKFDDNAKFKYVEFKNQ